MPNLIPTLTPLGVSVCEGLRKMTVLEVSRLHGVHTLKVDYDLIDKKANQITYDFWRLYHQKIENAISERNAPFLFEYPKDKNHV